MRFELTSEATVTTGEVGADSVRASTLGFDVWWTVLFGVLADPDLLLGGVESLKMDGSSGVGGDGDEVLSRGHAGAGDGGEDDCGLHCKMCCGLFWLCVGRSVCVMLKK